MHGVANSAIDCLLLGVQKPHDLDGVAGLPAEVPVEGDRAKLSDDRLARPVDLLDPGPEVLGVLHRRRHAEHLDVRRTIDDDLLPDAASVWVPEVVHFIEHHQPDRRKPRRRLLLSTFGSLGAVHDVPKDLGRHHHDICLGVQGGVARLQTKAVLPESLAHFNQLLVTQRLQSGNDRCKNK
jgi:hypothetical protein